MHNGLPPLLLQQHALGELGIDGGAVDGPGATCGSRLEREEPIASHQRREVLVDLDYLLPTAVAGVGGEISQPQAVFSATEDIAREPSRPFRLTFAAAVEFAGVLNQEVLDQARGLLHRWLADGAQFHRLSRVV